MPRSLPHVGRRIREGRSAARHISHTVAIGVAVYGGDHRRCVGSHRLRGGYPSADLVQALLARKIARGQFSLGERANSTGPETRDESYEDLRGGEGIRERPMAPYDLNAEPITESAQAIGGQVRIRETRERTHIEKSRDRPGETSARIFTIDDGKVIANIVTNDDGTVDALLERCHDVPEFWRAPQVLLGEAMDFRR